MPFFEMLRKAPERLSGLDGLDNPGRTKLLAIIDKFRELGVSEDLSLPQVCHMHADGYVK